MGEDVGWLKPQMEDLVSARVRASPDEGLIFLDAQRMLLIDVARMGFLCKELIATLGMERAKGLLMQMGYASQARSASCTNTARASRPPSWR